MFVVDDGTHPWAEASWNIGDEITVKGQSFGTVVDLDRLAGSLTVWRTTTGAKVLNDGTNLFAGCRER